MPQLYLGLQDFRNLATLRPRQAVRVYQENIGRGVNLAGAVVVDELYPLVREPLLAGLFPLATCGDGKRRHNQRRAHAHVALQIVDGKQRR